MQNISNDIKNKNYLMLCEIHHPERHGKTHDSAPNIETHYLVFDRFEPFSGISFCELDEYQEYDTDDEYESDDDDIIDSRGLSNINNELRFLRDNYSNTILNNIDSFVNHPTIRNYANIISNPNYIKPEIGEYIILPTQEAIAILKTFWLRIIQRKWKKVFKHRNEIIKLRCNPSNLRYREIHGKWPSNCDNFPTLNGMLSDLK